MSGIMGEKGLDVLLQAMKQPLLYIGFALIIIGSMQALPPQFSATITYVRPFPS
ncbi:MAG: hypothetical protein ABSC06_39370 [Rhodopila sp.]